MTADAKMPESARILVVDDEPDLRTLYELTLLREGHQVTTAGTLAEGRHWLATQVFDVVITDMRLPDGDGMALLHELSGGQRRERCIVITAYGSAESAVEALKIGAFDYLTKPVDLKQFRSVVRSAVQAPAATEAAGESVAAATAQLPAAGQQATPGMASDLGVKGRAALDRLVGQSAVMQSVKRRIVKVARSMAPVLIFGESGTGKELVARAVHACSHRADGPFVPVNCGAIPENLLEAEFFGVLKGAFTGATQDREGFFHAAAGGTLFLDEIGDLPLSMQAKLLRAIQERRVRQLGGTNEEPVDVRIVSASHRRLAAEVQAGRFRQDLFYRLNVIEVVIPALRERREDIPAICTALLARIAAESGLDVLELSPDRMAEIADAPLPGNVRELENLLYRAVALGDGDSNLGALAPLDDVGIAVPAAEPPISPAVPAPEADDTDLAPGESLAEWLDRKEYAIVLRVLGEVAFDHVAAAERLGLTPRQMRHRLVRLRLDARAGLD